MMLVALLKYIQKAENSCAQGILDPILIRQLKASIFNSRIWHDYRV